MIPIIYWGNFFAEGALSGSTSTDANPGRRVGDGSINLPYEATSGSPPSGVIQVTLSEAKAPDAFVLVLGDVTSGTRFTLESEDLGGGNNATILDFTLTADTDRFVQTITGATARAVWRLTVVSGAAQASFRELQLASAQQLPRSPEVGIDRTRVRQFTRIPIPGGQPFVKREGPRLRRTLYSFVAISGLEVSGLERFADGVEGGDAFTLVDDLAAQYWSELVESDVGFPDQAGVFTMQLGFQEIAVE